MPTIRAAVFDAYGTLLDVHAAMARHAARLGPDWQRISADWRTKQIEYTWVRSLAGPAHHRDFWQLTQEALAFVAARHAIADQTLLADVLAAYRQLDAYPEVPAMLAALRDKGVARAILSNGEPGMLADAVRAAGIATLLDAVLSVETVGVFKPDPRVYRLVADCFGLSPGAIGFFSSNPWDAFGALAFGFRVFWVNRTAQPDEYGLRGQVTEMADLAALPDAIAV
jgi:2-haloacid dehalogenase